MYALVFALLAADPAAQILAARAAAEPQAAAEVMAARAAQPYADPAATAVAVAPQEGPFQVVRVGDGQLTCEALAAEINGLGGELDRIQAAQMAQINAMTTGMMAMRGGMGGGMMGVGGAAGLASMIPGVGAIAGLAGGVAGQAMAVGRAAKQKKAMADQQKQMEAINASAAGSAETVNQIEERKAHLKRIFTQKAC